MHAVVSEHQFADATQEPEAGTPALGLFQCLVVQLQQRLSQVFLGGAYERLGEIGEIVEVVGSFGAMSEPGLLDGLDIAFLDLDIVRVLPQFGGDDLRVGGLMTLTLGNRTHARNRAAGWMDPDLTAVEHANAENVTGLTRAGADDFGEGAQADTH